MFKVGDRVRYVAKGLYPEFVGQTGTVVETEWDTGVQWDKRVNTFSNYDGHDCRGNGKTGHCWYVDSSSLELIPAEKEVKWELKDLDKLEQLITINIHSTTLSISDKIKIICVRDRFPYVIKTPDGELYFYKEKPNLTNVIDARGIGGIFDEPDSGS